MGRENFVKINEKKIELKEKIKNSKKNYFKKLNFLKKDLFDENISSERINNMYSYMEKNLKKLPKCKIDTKDLMNTFRILENINKLNSKKILQNSKIDENMKLETRRNNQEREFFHDFYAEDDDFIENLNYQCVFPNCGKIFANADQWKNHYDYHL